MKRCRWLGIEKNILHALIVCTTCEAWKLGWGIAMANYNAQLCGIRLYDIANCQLHTEWEPRELWLLLTAQASFNYNKLLTIPLFSQHVPYCKQKTFQADWDIKSMPEEKLFLHLSRKHWLALSILFARILRKKTHFMAQHRPLFPEINQSISPSEIRLKAFFWVQDHVRHPGCHLQGLFRDYLKTYL